MERRDSNTERLATTRSRPLTEEVAEDAAGSLSPTRHRWRLALEQRWREALEASEAAGRLEREPVPAEPAPAELSLAESVADVGSAVPEFRHHPPWRRRASRLVARGVLLLTGFLTAHQRIVNRALLLATRSQLRRLAAVESELAIQGRRSLEWERELAFLRLSLADADASDWESPVADQGERLTALAGRVLEVERQLSRRPEATSPPELLPQIQLAIDSLGRHLGALAEGAAAEADPDVPTGDAGTEYLAFEDRFRGGRSLIVRRLEGHLPVVMQAVRRHPDAPVLDLGCGRGEWLEILRERGVEAAGTDLSLEMVEACRERGLNAFHSEALDFLRQRGPASAAAITTFHLLEHLPTERMLALLDEAVRVLRPGGLFLAEAPNPENLRVGASDFWRDLTHRRPLHPETLAFLLERRGCRHVRIERLSAHRGGDGLVPLPPEDPVADRINPLIERLNGLVEAAPDYCVHAERPWDAVS